MSTVAGITTAEDLWKLPADGTRHELVNGELRTMSPAGFEHGATGSRFHARLHAYVGSQNMGVVVGADVGFVVARDPDTVRSPDAAFIRQDRIPNPWPVKFWEGAPDLAVEVVSPSDTVYEVDETVQTWLDAGTLDVMVINPRQRSIRIIGQDGQSRTLHVVDIVEGLVSLPGFRCAVADIFA